MLADDHRRGLLGMFLALGLTGHGGGAVAAELVPFDAVYDLTLSGTSLDLEGGNGRIAAVMTRESCGRIDMDYRFMARFDRADATVVTEQHTVSREDLAAGTFTFETRTFVDGAPESTIRGSAAHAAGGTRIEIEEPEHHVFELPLSVFPSAHTMDLIDRARKGETIVETRLYDGDNEADKRLTTTAILGPAPVSEAGDAGADGKRSPAGALAGLRRWRVAEAYYNSDGDADGLPLFQTSYTLYENGVSDALTIDTGDYAFKGSLSSLKTGAVPDCRPAE